MEGATKKFAPSRYQTGIFDWIQTGSGHAVVEAVAGSGKTTTMVEALGLMDGKVLFCAFNKHISEELARKLAQRGISHVSVSTIHSLGFAAVRKAIRGARIEDRKLGDIVIDIMAQDREDRFDHERRAVFAAAERLANLCRLTLTPVGDRDALLALVDRFDIETNGGEEEILEAVPDILAECVRAATDDHVIDFTDMIWLPAVLKLIPDRYDWVCVDEAQDLNVAQRELVLKAVRDGGRILAVGDRRQAIYGFAGADVTSVQSLIERLGATTLPLSICYRCPASHVDLAKKIVPQIESREGAPKGTVLDMNCDEAVRSMTEGDLVICRVNAPLAEIAMALIRAGKKATLRGRDIGGGLVSLVKKMKAGNDIGRLIEKLMAYAEKEAGKLVAARKEVRAQAIRDKVETLVALADGIQTVEALIDRVGRIFSDDAKGVALSSVHRAKGLEADRVFIYREELMPHPKASAGWQMEQEWNLRYVALTRAKAELVMVSE